MFFGFELYCTMLLIVKYVITVSVKQLTAELNSRYCEGPMRLLATITQNMKYDPPPPHQVGRKKSCESGKYGTNRTLPRFIPFGEVK